MVQALLPYPHIDPVLLHIWGPLEVRWYALSYIAGGMVPLAPYFFSKSAHQGLLISVIVTLIALFVFGYIKGRFTTTHPFRSAWQTVFVGGLAAAAAFMIAKWLGEPGL